MKKKLLAVLLTSALLLTGCGVKPAPQEQQVKGGYREQAFSWPEDFCCTGIYPRADNGVTLLGTVGPNIDRIDCTNGTWQGYRGGLEIIDVQPDGTHTKRELPWEEDLIARCADAPHHVSMAMDEEGNLYVLASAISRFGSPVPQEPFQLYQVKEDALVPIKAQFSGLDADWMPEVKIEGDHIVCELDGATNGFVFVSNNDGNWGIWGVDGTLHHPYVMRIGSTMGPHSIRNGYVWTGMTQEWDTAYKMPDFESAGKMEIPWGYIFPDFSGDGFYHMTDGTNMDTFEQQEKIFSHYTLNGDTREVLMRGNDFTWGSRDVWYGCETPDHAFWMILQDREKQGLYRYEYDPEKTVENTLTIFSMQSDKTLTQTIALWNQRHPETQIEHIVGASDLEQGAMTEEDVIRRLNSQLLAGDGPDLLILDGLPAEALMRQGMLTDLTGQLELDDVRPNVLASFQRAGALYAVPTGINPCIAGGEEAQLDDRIRSLDGLADAVEEMPDMEQSNDCCLSFVLNSYEKVFDLFYPASAAEIWQEGKLNQDAYLRFVRSVNRIARRTHSQTIKTIHNQAESNRETAHEEMYEKYSLSSLNEFHNGKSRWFVDDWDSAYGAGSFSRVRRGTTGNITGTDYVPIHVVPMPSVKENTKGVFVPSCSAAIPASSTQNRELALQFIQLMLCEEIQSDPNRLTGLAVTQKGWENALRTVRKTEPVVLTQDPAELLAGMQPTLLDPILQDAAQKASAKLYDGEWTEQEACAAIEQAAELRLAEQG